MNIYVGPERKVFQIHKGLLCAYSSFFNAALHGHFSESKSESIEMPEDDVEVVSYFRTWIYVRRLSTVMPLHHHTNIDPKYHLRILKMSKFADQIDCPALALDALVTFQDTILLESSDESFGVIHPEVTTFAWKALPDHSVVRALIVKILARRDVRASSIAWDQHPPALLAEVVKTVKENLDQASDEKGVFPCRAPRADKWMAYTMLYVTRDCSRCHQDITEDGHHDIEKLERRKCDRCDDELCTHFAHSRPADCQ